MLPQHPVFRSLSLCAALAAVAAALPAPAWAQGKLEARYSVTLAGLPIGKGNWVISLGDTRYSAAASGVTTGLMRVFTGGEGTTASQGVINGGALVSSVYAATIKSRKKTDQIRLTVNNGNVKELKIEPPPEKDSERVPITKAHEHGILDPMAATLLRVPGEGNPLTPEACARKLSIFDGRLRYDLQLAFKRMDHVKADKGYAGPALVCAVYFSPVAGHIPSRRTIQYLTQMRDIEVWLAPIAGTRVLVPFRASGPTPLGEARLEAEQFVTVARPSRASLGATQTR